MKLLIYGDVVQVNEQDYLDEIVSCKECDWGGLIGDMLVASYEKLPVIMEFKCPRCESIFVKALEF